MTIKRRTLILLKLWATIAVFVGVFVVWGYVYFKTPFFNITAYQLQGVEERYNDKIGERLQKISSEVRFYILPSNRIIGYPSLRIQEAIVEVFPNTESVSIFPVGLHTLRIRVNTYKPLFKYDETRGITKEGIIYTELNDMSKLPTFFIASSTTYEIVRGNIRATKIEDLSERDFINLSEFIKKINRTIFIVGKIHIDSYGDVTLYDKDEKSKILFSNKTDINKVWSNIVSAIDTEPLLSKLEKEKDNLDYLDARFGNKIFYKFTNTPRETIIKPHDVTSEVATTTVR